MGAGQGKGDAKATVTADQLNKQLLEKSKSMTLQSGQTLTRSKSLADTLSEVNLPMELGYHYLDYDNIRMITA